MPPLYSATFETNAPGAVPDDMLVLDGAFGVVTAPDGNKVLELPGSPLETYGVIFGPTEAAGLLVLAGCGGNELQEAIDQPADEGSPLLAALHGVVARLDPDRHWLPTLCSTAPGPMVESAGILNAHRKTARRL